MRGPVFRIGRAKTCQLRPKSELVSDEHAEFTVSTDRVTLRDLGSRYGTRVNGKPLNARYELEDRDLVEIGPLTFAVSIQGRARRPISAAQAAESSALDTDPFNDLLARASDVAQVAESSASDTGRALFSNVKCPLCGAGLPPIKTNRGFGGGGDHTCSKCGQRVSYRYSPSDHKTLYVSMLTFPVGRFDPGEKVYHS